MTKRLQPMIVVALVLLVPTLVLAGANKFSVAKAVSSADNMVVVPLEVTNEVELAALDIPLKFSAGVTLKEVDFKGTRVEYFDLKVARIDNENHTVVIGLLPQFSPEAKPDLAAGTGVVANLVFQVDDPTISRIDIESVEMTNPTHSLAFVTHQASASNASGIQLIKPDFISVSQSLSTEGNVPVSFGLQQNYPNPFNPATVIQYAIPNAARVELSVYNVLGQKVSTLVDEEMAAGNYSVEWDASQYSSGVYFYRIVAGDYNATKKMMLVK